MHILFDNGTPRQLTPPALRPCRRRGQGARLGRLVVGNEKAKEQFEQNCFTVTRQLRYSRDEIQYALDIVLVINGLLVCTFELKNNLTKQTVDDAVWQYKKDRNPREKLFKFSRYVAHFAVDENEVRFCTHLQGKASWFLPFNRGWDDGAGNPPNPYGLKADYLWREVCHSGVSSGTQELLPSHRGLLR